MRDVMHDLKRLGASKAPAGMSDRVLTMAGLVDSYAAFDTVIGRVFVAWNSRGISSASRDATAADFEARFKEEVGRPLQSATPPAELAAKIENELAGRKRLSFDLRSLTDFEREVLTKTREIPRGQVRPYAWVAREIGHPAAVRAVGSALARNPIPDFIPCHRVVRSDGVIGNYGGGGPEAKRKILRLEGVEPDRLEELARSGVRYHGSRTTHIFCFPTCRYSVKVAEANEVYFRNEAEARKAGYRPCKVCRPAAA